MPTSGQSKLIELGSLLGYPPYAGGYCHGFNMKWLEASFIHENEQFAQRVETIFNTSPELLIDRINHVKEKAKQHEVMSPEDIDLLEILSFYEGVSLYQRPHAYSTMFNAPLTQEDINDVTKLAASNKMESAGGLSAIFSKPWLHSQQNIAEYLDGLAFVICRLDFEPQTTIGFELSSSRHVIALSYQTDSNTWTIMDINQWPPKSFDVMSSEECVPHIFNGLQSGHIEQKHSMAFITRVIIAGENPLLVKKLNDYHKEFTITEGIAKRVGSGGVTVLTLAAETGDVAMITELVAHGANINHVNERGVTPICIAAGYGQVEAVSKLAELGANLDSAVVYAATYGHVDVISKLDQLGADLNAPSSEDGATLLFLAAQNGREEIARYLLCRDIKIASNLQGQPFISTFASLTKFTENLAESIQNRMSTLIKSKIESGEGESAISVTPREIAVVMGHDSVISVIDECEATLKENIKAASDYREVVFEVRNKAVADSTAVIPGRTPVNK
jgi:ankyrin repeat protein